MSNFRRRLMCVQQHGGLPAGYQEVEYIESTGTQWIDLNLYATDVGSWELEGAFTKIPTATKFEGNGSFGNADNRFDIGVYNNKFWIAIGAQNNTITADYNKHYFKLDRINGRAYLDSRILSFSPVNWLTQTKKMRLFGRTFYIGNDDDQYCASMKCYSNKMYDNNNNLIMNLIPCLDTHSAPCMYDTVSKQTFYNQGTGEFRYPIDEKYTPVEYLESTGTQYIDTGIKLSNNSNVEINAKLTATSKRKSYYLFGSSLDQKRYMIAVGSTTDKYLADFKNSSYRINSSVSAFDSAFHIHKINNLNYYIDNILQGSQTSLNFSDTENAYLFDVRGRSTDSSVGVQAWQIKYCKIYDNDTLVRNFIPCYRKSDNKPGLYDTVTKEFYTNQGTGEFLYE